MFGLFERNNFHDGLKRDIRITSDAYKAALKRDYINPKYLSFANPELQEMVSEDITKSWFLCLNLDADALVEQLEKLTKLFILKWLVTTGKARELEAMLEKDRAANPLMHYGDDVIETFVENNFTLISQFVAKEWSPYFRRISRNITPKYVARIFGDPWRFWKRKESMRYMRYAVSSVQQSWRISSFKEKYGEWRMDDGYFINRM